MKINLPEEQQAIRARCFHPNGAFFEFTKEEVEQSIPSRFQKIAREYPNRIAIKGKSQTLTYRALNQSANRVAHTLLAKCGEGQEPIALLFEDKIPTIVGILGVLKAGKICVPLDPGFHETRVRYVLQNSQAILALINSENLSLAYPLAQDTCAVINIDDIDGSLSSEDLGLSIPPDALSYILYTSGSTGQPKGVIQNHRNLLYDVRGYTNTFHLSIEDRLTLFASCSGGEGIKNAFCALLNGATAYPWNIKQEGFAGLAGWLITEEISVYISTSTIFRNFLSASDRQKKFPRIRVVRLGSGVVGKKDVELYKEYLSPECILVNWLSSTETGNFAHYFMDKESEITGDLVPVGYAVEDKEVLLLDDNRQQVGYNQIGELAVKSCYLSPGYWRSPDLIQAKFLPDPEDGDKRIYLTGDLGRMRPDHCLEYIGRKDYQVKVRGQRIEVAEIEKSLLQFPAIQEAVVVAREDQPGDQRLIAYMVCSSQSPPSASQLRGFLKDRLPTYMIPSLFVTLDALPVAPNGKVDRQRLPVPNKARPEMDTPYAPSRTPIEKTLVAIWTDVLQLDRVGIHDSFFDLGGHSLLATQITSRVREVFGTELPVRVFFENPTVADFAVQIVKIQAQGIAVDKMAEMIADLEALSEEEAEFLLSRKS